MATIAEPLITLDDLARSWIAPYTLTVEQVQEAVRENLDRSVRVKGSKDLWNLTVEIGGKEYVISHTKRRSGPIEVKGIHRCERTVGMLPFALGALELYGLTWEQVEQVVRENLHRSVPVKRDREVRNLTVEIKGRRFDIGVTVYEGKYGPVQILGIRKAK